MATQLKTLRLDSKGKSSEKMKQAVNELEYLTTFNWSISQAMARTMQDLFEGIFINMANFTLARRDSYLDYLHSGVMQDTVNALRTSPVHLNALFPDQLIAKAEEEISKTEERRSLGTSHRQQNRFHPYSASDKSTSHHDRKSTLPAWKQIRQKTSNKPGKVVSRPQHSPRSLPRGSSLINDNHCVISVTGQKNSVHVTGQGDLNPAPVVSENSKVTLNFNVDSHVANAHIVTGLPQRKGVNPTFCQMYTEIKYVENVSCVGHLCSVDLVTNAQHAVIDPPVGARLKQCWKKMGVLGFESKSSHHNKGGLYPPVPVQTLLDKVTDCNKQLKQSNQTVLPCGGTVSADKQKCSRTGRKPKFTGFLQPAIFGTQTQQPIMDLSTLNTFLNTESFKMETPETIRTSLQAGEWVTSIDYKDAYFHIPIHSQSRKYMHFHLQGQSYQFKALPFGLSTAPMEFTVVAKEVKLMALQKGIRTHQYLDDWLVRASTHDTCLQHTQTLVTLCQELGWLVNKGKSELVPKQVFNFVGYQFDLKEGKVRPTGERWQTLTDKIRSILSDPVCPVRQFMSLIGLLTTTEKQVHLGRLHMRPIQWHLKNNWRVPESLEKVIPVPKSLHPHLRWWLEESNVLLGQPLHPLKHALQIFTDASKEGWGAHLDEHTARGTWSL